METEIKFVILGDVGEDQLFSLVEESCTEWAWLSNGEKRVIYDTYYDTPNNDLRSRKYGLRVRSQGNEVLVTLKGPATVTSSGALEREEFEGPLNEGLVNFLIEKIRSLGLVLVDIPQCESDPHNFLSSLGLNPIQDRKTERTIRRLRPKTMAEPVSEFAVDTVYYRIGSLDVVHREIEIELMKGAPVKSYEELVHALKKALSAVSKVWTIDKLALGFLLCDYHDKDLLREFVGEGGRLEKKAYEMMEKVAKKV